MSSTFNLPFALLAAVTLLPLIPAYIIFKLLPASADVSGPLQGFEIKLGGAFGAYFALVVLVLFTKNSIWDPPPPPACQVWTVSGTIDDETGSPIAPLSWQDIQLQPPNPQEQNGWFSIRIPVQPGEIYPLLTISHSGYQQVRVSLDPAATPPRGVTVDAKNGTVAINDLRLQPLPAYKVVAPLNAIPSGAPAGPHNPPAGGHP